MGVRQLKAQHTRAWIAGCALELFERRGYDATTLEEVASAADVSPSTLYRYFPTKDSLLVEHPAFTGGGLAQAFEERPDDEPLTESLGNAVLECLRGADAAVSIVERIRTQIDQVPAARARMWDYWSSEIARLMNAIEGRHDAPESTEKVAIAAQAAMMVMVMALDASRVAVGVSSEALGIRYLHLMSDPDILRMTMPSTRQAEPARCACAETSRSLGQP